LEDYSNTSVGSGLRVVPASRQFVHSAITNNLTVSAVAIDNYTVRLTFNRPVGITGPTLENVRLRLYSNTTTAIQRHADDMDGSGTNFDDAMYGTDGTQYDVTFSTAIVAGTHNLYIHYLLDSDVYGRIGDSWGNVLPNNTVASFTVAETVSPQMISAQVAGPKTVKITYSRTVTNNGFEPGQYRYYVDELDLVGIPATSISASGNVVTVVFGTLAPDYEDAIIEYTQSAFAVNRTRDQATGGYAVSPDELVGILASE